MRNFFIEQKSVATIAKHDFKQIPLSQGKGAAFLEKIFLAQVTESLDATSARTVPFQTKKTLYPNIVV